MWLDTRLANDVNFEPITGNLLYINFPVPKSGLEIILNVGIHSPTSFCLKLKMPVEKKALHGRIVQSGNTRFSVIQTFFQLPSSTSSGHLLD